MLSFLSAVSKIFENVAFEMWFFISSVVLGLPVLLQIFWQLHLTKLLELSRGQGLHKLYPRLRTDFGMLVFFTNSSLMKLNKTGFSALFLHFSVNIQLSEVQSRKSLWKCSIIKASILPGSILDTILSSKKYVPVLILCTQNYKITLYLRNKFFHA